MLTKRGLFGLFAGGAAVAALPAAAKGVRFKSGEAVRVTSEAATEALYLGGSPPFGSPATVVNRGKGMIHVYGPDVSVDLKPGEMALFQPTPRGWMTIRPT